METWKNFTYERVKVQEKKGLQGRLDIEKQNALESERIEKLAKDLNAAACEGGEFIPMDLNEAVKAIE